MNDTNIATVAGWFAGRVPDGWFEGAPEVSRQDDQVVVVGTLGAPAVAAGATPETVAGAAAGRIARFREETRGYRIHIAREAEREFKVKVQWGARVGDATVLFNKGGSGRGEKVESAAKPAGVEV